MADLLSHVLLAFGLFTVAGWGVSWLNRRWVVVGMVGSIIPDLNRIDMFVDDLTIEQTLGIPFSWGAIHTLGGVVVLSALGAVLFATREQQLRAFGLLTAGGCSHLLFDAVKAWADGSGGTHLYPFSWWRNPTPGWYVSSDFSVLAFALIVASGAAILEWAFRRA